MSSIKPFTRSLVAQSHPPYYRLHKYWARKPGNIVRTYIEHFTNPQEIVFDPFAGSGVTMIEALLAGRRAVTVDINPISSLIINGTAFPVNNLLALDAFKKIEKQVKPLAESLFATSCHICTKEVTANFIVWSSTGKCSKCQHEILLGKAEKVKRKYTCPNCSNLILISSREVTGEKPIEIWFSCERCNPAKAMGKKPDDRDLRHCLDSQDPALRPSMAFSNMLPSKRLLVHEGMKVESFFTTRNHRVLAKLLEEINSIEDSKLKQLFTLTFTASVAQASRLIAYRNALSTGGPAWTVSGFWIPPLHLEMNAWNCFANRFERVLYGKDFLQQSAKEFIYKPVNTFEHLRNEGNALIATRSSSELHDFLPDESVDYIFTDPPYGDSVPYLEYSALWLGWLGLCPHYEEEVIISDSQARNKDINDYRIRLKATFAECYRVLKKGRWLSITFHNRNFDVWSSLISSVVEVGFKFINCTYQVPAVVPAKAQLSKAGSVTGDIIINFQKLEQHKSPYPIQTETAVDEIVLDEAERVIAERGGTASTDEVIRGVIMELLAKDMVYLAQYDILSVLSHRFDHQNGSWSLRPHENYLVNKYPQLSDTVESIIKQCLLKGETDKKSIIAKVLTELQNGRTPNIDVIIKQYERQIKNHREKLLPTQDTLFAN